MDERALIVRNSKLIGTMMTELRQPEEELNEKQPAPDPDLKLVRVLDTEQESEAMVVQSLLESAGIESEVTALDAPQDVLPGVGGVVVMVREEDADAARKLIAEQQQPIDSTTETES